MTRGKSSSSENESVMKLRNVLQGLAAPGVMALALFCNVRVEGQVPGRAVVSPIPSLTEPSEGLAIKDASAQTGYATFASS